MNPPPVRKSADAAAPSKSSRNDAVVFKQALELMAKAIPAAQTLIVTTLPRGSLQLAQPARMPETLLKGYTAEFHLHDRLTWQAILSQRPVRAGDVFQPDDRFVTEHLQLNEFAFAAAAPLAAPVLHGYPGAIHVYRSADAGDFTAEELRKLAHAAGEIDVLVGKARAARHAEVQMPDIALTPRPSGRLFVFDAKGKQRVPVGEFQTIDLPLRDSIAREVADRLSNLAKELDEAPPDGPAEERVVGQRLQLPDARGDLWTFRAVTYTAYPAIGDGPFIVLCLQPSCREWADVRPADLQADPELARLIPALKFMREEFSRGPGLTEIARTVQLSPFHFHRRFT
ncbi:MAG: hypothetical protein ABIP55_03310, partial [Tepidisphaeraceae bacterium]